MHYQLTLDRAYPYHPKHSIALPVKLRLGEKVTTFEAHIETGASLCIFQRRLGEDLGIEVQAGLREQINTATGSFIAYGHQVTLSTLELDFEAYVYFAADENFNRNVLGRNGWLDRVKLGIIYYDRELYLTPYGSVEL